MAEDISFLSHFLTEEIYLIQDDVAAVSAQPVKTEEVDTLEEKGLKLSPPLLYKKRNQFTSSLFLLKVITLNTVSSFLKMYNLN